MSYTLHHGDCLEKMREVPDASVDMVLCDLPYGVTQNAWDSVIPLDRLWEQWLRVAKKDCSFVLFGQGMFTAKLMFSQPALWKYNLVWDKHLAGDFLNSHRRPMRIHEDVAVFQQGTPPYNPQMAVGQRLHTRKNYPLEGVEGLTASTNYGKIKVQKHLSPGSTDKYPESIVSFQKPHPATAVHPTEKPVNLLRWLILTYTDPGATVLDSTMGSGSTGVAALLEKRDFVGIEIDDDYFNIASRRIKEAEEEMKSRLF